MGPPTRIVALLLVAVSFAACTRPAPTPEPTSGATEASAALSALEAALVNDHDHSDPGDHPHVEWRLDQVWESNLPMNRLPISPASEFQIHGQYAYVSLFHPSAGMVILDLTDPAVPEQVGYFDTGSAYVNDVELSPDGNWAFLPTSPIETAENSANRGTALVGDYGIQVVDVANKRQPRLAAVWAAPDPDPKRLASTNPDGARQAASMGYHRCDVEVIGGQLYVFGASLGNPRVDILRFDPAPVPRLVQVGVYLSDDAKDPLLDRSSSPTGFGTHDVTVDPDPLQGFPLMAVSHWRSGAHFVDVRDPANPKFLGRWNKFDHIQQGNVHNVEFTQIEGARVAVVVPEYPVDPVVRGTHWIVNITSFASPTLLGNWSIPGQHPGIANDPFSTNRVLIRNGTLFIAHFHAGVYVVDVSSLEKAAEPELLGYVLPKGETIVPYSTVAANPYVYDAIPRGEYLYYSDLTGGFHVAHMSPEVVRGNVW